MMLFDINYIDSFNRMENMKNCFKKNLIDIKYIKNTIIILSINNLKNSLHFTYYDLILHFELLTSLLTVDLNLDYLDVDDIVKTSDDKNNKP